MPLQWVSIDVEPSAAPTVRGLVHRTSPKVGRASDGQRYFFKGPDPHIVLGEVLGYSVAEIVGLQVPSWALCRMPPKNDIFFASEAMSFSGGIESLISARQVTNPHFLEDCVAFDVWTANTDRNVGNVVANPDPAHPGKAELFAIDFEQAQVLNGTDFLTVGQVEPRLCWPTGILAALCREIEFPSNMCRSIGAVTIDDVDRVVEEMEADIEFPRGEWVSSAKRQLVSRGGRIETLVREAWDANQ
jgi:hypothetical protein